MPGGKPKGKKKDKPAAAEEEEGGEESKGKKTGGKGKKGKSKGKCNMDILADAAMDNVYYGCHNVQELLQARGFHPPDYSKKKKKGKR